MDADDILDEAEEPTLRHKGRHAASESRNLVAGAPIAVVVSLVMAAISATITGTWQLAVLHEAVAHVSDDLNSFKRDVEERRISYDVDKKVQAALVASIDKHMEVIGARLDYLISNQANQDVHK